jgi:hypothetical protein
MSAHKKRILLILPEQLLELTDEAAELLQVTRLGFIRQAIALRLASFQRDEKQIMENLADRQDLRVANAGKVVRCRQSAAKNKLWRI